MKASPLLLVSVALLLAGCADLCQLRDPRTGHVIPATFTGTTGPIQGKKAMVRPAILRRVDTIACGGFERAVFTFDGRHVPGFRAEYVSKPVHECGSGNPVALAGTKALQLQFSQAQAHTDAGKSTIAERNRALNQPLTRQLVATCDFEGEVIWVFGLGARSPYRVTELSDPPRLVLDLRR